MDDDRTPAELPPLPYHELRAGIVNDPIALARLDELHADLERDRHDPERIGEHVTALRGIAAIEARVANWWESPATQRFFNNLTNAGL